MPGLRALCDEQYKAFTKVHVLYCRLATESALTVWPSNGLYLCEKLKEIHTESTGHLSQVATVLLTDTSLYKSIVHPRIIADTLRIIICKRE